MAVLILPYRRDANFGALLKGDRGMGEGWREECEVDSVKNNEAIKMGLQLSTPLVITLCAEQK